VIIPSIDLQDGQAVQLVQGDRKALDAGDPRPLARRFGVVGEVAGDRPRRRDGSREQSRQFSKNW
jgi:hypothetical protein